MIGSAANLIRGLSLAAIALTTPSQSRTATPAESGPSFSCARTLNVVEATICANPSLSAADREMATLYQVARVSAFGSGLSGEQEAQRKTLVALQACARSPDAASMTRCLRNTYDQRSYELAIAVSTGSPGIALPVIRRVDPAYAPIAEAIVIWATEQQGADWASPARAGKRARIMALLGPTMTNLLTKREDAFARDILADPGKDGVAVKTIDDVLTSPGHFAKFLNVIGPYLDDGNSNPGRAVPCAAIIGHPALLAATGSAYGSTLDGFVLSTDCGETLPPTPALAALDAKLLKAWPPCEGTIRFAAYRTYGVGMDAARLGIPMAPSRSALPRRRGVSAADIAAAQSELAAYYVRYLGKSRSQSAALASRTLGAVLDSAQQCE